MIGFITAPDEQRNVLCWRRSEWTVETRRGRLQYDITVPLKTGMVVYPGDAPVLIERTCEVAKGDRVTLSRFSMGLHSGTHIDAPLHLFEKGLSIDRLPLAVLIGTAQVIEIRDEESITASRGRGPSDRGVRHSPLQDA